MGLSSEQLVEVLRAAGEPSRLRILALLAREELAVMELSQILDQSQPRVSRHLKLLVEAGLAERFPDGAWVFYRLTSDGPRRAVLDQALAGRDWLIGETFGVADLNVAAVMNVMELIRFDFSHHANVRRWADACYARPALARAKARG
jgi:DNA-binding transcriptional ArsR family regulator